jgi:hypothetical protein
MNADGARGKFADVAIGPDLARRARVRREVGRARVSPPPRHAPVFLSARRARGPYDER